MLPPAAMNAWMDRARLAADDPMERAWITAFADGSPGVAKLAADHGFHAWDTQLDPLLARLERGGWTTELGDAMAALVDEFAAGWGDGRGWPFQLILGAELAVDTFFFLSAFLFGFLFLKVLQSPP